MIRRNVIASLLVLPAASLSAQDFLTVKPIVQAVRNGDEEKVRQALLGTGPRTSSTATVSRCWSSR